MLIIGSVTLFLSHTDRPVFANRIRPLGYAMQYYKGPADLALSSARPRQRVRHLS